MNNSYDIAMMIIEYHVKNGKYPTTGNLYYHLSIFKKQNKSGMVIPQIKSLFLSYDPNIFDTVEERNLRKYGRLKEFFQKNGRHPKKTEDACLFNIYKNLKANYNAGKLSRKVIGYFLDCDADFFKRKKENKILKVVMKFKISNGRYPYFIVGREIGLCIKVRKFATESEKLDSEIRRAIYEIELDTGHIFDFDDVLEFVDKCKTSNVLDFYIYKSEILGSTIQTPIPKPLSPAPVQGTEAQIFSKNIFMMKE